MAQGQQPKHSIEQVAAQSPDMREELLDQLQAIAPEAFTEGKLDLDKLTQLTAGAVEDKPERFAFTWAGKRDAVAILQAPTRATLVPDPENSINFDEAQHVFIEGENLETLKVLYRAYFGRVKMVYIDPPYNTGNDLIYPDNFADPLDHYLRVTGQKCGNGDYLSSSPETSGRYHSAWLSMMYPRLVLARQLLRDDGVIFITIDDHEMANLRLLMNEIFGEENFVASIIWKKMDSPSRNDKDRYVTNYHDYILCYARSRERAGLKQKTKPEILKAYPLQLSDGRYRTIADIAHGRIQKSIERLQQQKEQPDPDEREGPENLSLCAFKLAGSSMRRWSGGVKTKDADAYAAQLDAFADTLVDGCKPENVIWEVALREGFALTSEIEKQEIEGQTFWRVTDPEREQSFHICLDDALSIEAVRALGLTRENLFVCRDKALDDTLAANLALQCRLKVL